MSLDRWEGVNRQKIYDHFSIEPRNIFDWHLITLFGYYTPQSYSIMQQVQLKVLQNRYFLGLVADYESIDVQDPKGGSRREAPDEKSLRYLRSSELAIFLLLLQEGRKPPASGVTIETMDVLRNDLGEKCVFLIEGDMNIHFDTGFILAHPEYQRKIKIEEVQSDDIDGIAQIMIAKCKAFYLR